MVGARLFFLLENDAGSLLRPGDLFGTRGFAFNGALILAPAGAALYLWRGRLSVFYLDALALGFPLGMAVGRIGDVINGEHYGPPTDAPWGVRNSHPDADVPSSTVAYHSGGLYEVLLGLAVFAIVWPLRRRFARPLTALWAVVAAYAGGRFVMFFFRDDSDGLALGLSTSQWASLGLVALAAAGAWGSLAWKAVPFRSSATCLALGLLAAAGALASITPAAAAAPASWPPIGGPGSLFVHYGEEHLDDDDGMRILSFRGVCSGSASVTVTSGFESRASRVSVTSRPGAIVRSIRRGARRLPRARSTRVASVRLAQSARVLVRVSRGGRFVRTLTRSGDCRGGRIDSFWDARLGGRPARRGVYVIEARVLSDRSPVVRRFRVRVGATGRTPGGSPRPRFTG